MSASTRPAFPLRVSSAGDCARSPPASGTLNRRASFNRPLRNWSAQRWGNPEGRASERKAAIGSPPMAAISLSPRARQRCPTTAAGCQSRRKCTFSRVKSVVTSKSCPAGGRSTAQSSPMPASKSRFFRPAPGPGGRCALIRSLRSGIGKDNPVSRLGYPVARGNSHLSGSGTTIILWQPSTPSVIPPAPSKTSWRFCERTRCKPWWTSDPFPCRAACRTSIVSRWKANCPLRESNISGRRIWAGVAARFGRILRIPACACKPSATMRITCSRDGFQHAAAELVELATMRRTAIMCAEAVYFRCHRMLVSDWLTAHGHTVLHILDQKPPRPHRLTPEAQLSDGQLLYSGGLPFPR